MKGGFELTLLLVHVYLSHCCFQEAQVVFCQTIPEDFQPGLNTLFLIVKDVGELKSTLLNNTNLSSVTKLQISNAGVTGIAKGAFSSFQNLMSLILDQNLLTHMDPQWLGNPPLLNNLSITGNRIEVLTQSSLRGLRGLRKLSLNKNRIRTIDTRAFTDLTDLSELDLSENRLTRIPLEGFRSLRSTRMRLDGNPWNCSCAALDFIHFVKDLRRRSLLLGDMEVRCGSPPALEHQPVWNVTCERPPSSQPETSVQSKPTSAPSSPPPSETKTPTGILTATLTLSAVTTPPSSRPPSEIKTPTDILKTTHTLNSSSASSRPLSHADIVPTLIAVIVVLSMLLCVVCFLAVIYRRKRKSKTVMPRPEKEENTEVENSYVHSEKEDWTEDPHPREERRWFPGVRAKSANAILSTSRKDQITVQTEVEVSSENRQETDEGKTKETALSIQTENLMESNPDENTHYCTSLNIFENVPYLSIGTQQNNPNRQPGQRSQVGRGMQRIATWPPTEAQWQERHKTKGEDETSGADAFAAWIRHESLKIVDVVKNVEQEVQREKSDMEPRAQTQDGLKMNDCITLNHPQLPTPNDSCGDSLSVRGTCSSVGDDHHQTDPSPDQEELQTPHLEQVGTPEQKANTNSICTGAERTKGSDVKAGGGSRRRGGTRSTGSKGPSGGGGSPDDDALLYGNQYSAMDLLHEVVQNNGRWTRERWRQVQSNKQKGQG